MNCILIGVTPPGPEKAAWNTVNEILTKVDGFTVDWIASSKTQDEEGKPVDLICAATDALVDDVVAATANTITRDLGESYTCELWASAPAILPLRPLDGYDEHIVAHDNKRNFRSSEPAAIVDTFPDEWAASIMKKWGMFVQTSLLEVLEVEKLRCCIDEEIANIEDLISHHQPNLNIGKDVISFKEIASRGYERFDLLLSKTSKARNFVEHALLERIGPLIEILLNGRLGDTIDYDISVVYSKPGAPNQGWHADGDHQKGASDSGWGTDGWKVQLADAYALCLFVPLIDLNGETGYTQFWPASHRNRGLAGFGPVAEITGAVWDGKCRAGDAIWHGIQRGEITAKNRCGRETSNENAESLPSFLNARHSLSELGEVGILNDATRRCLSQHSDDDEDKKIIRCIEDNRANDIG
ncbi:hypothetical protein ACHAXA_004447 [Cyclostephanos tholiformis]|uniref:Uncharacterized protein n=1 Tax=Cyclostephanos tholiformis TaxID=382380 RepID=A0ABD3SBQ6_9STRA